MTQDILDAARRRFEGFTMPEPNSGCLIWMGALGGNNDYGLFTAGGHKYGAHRVAVMMAGRRIPRGYDVHHRCLNTFCVNERHLQPVPPATNQGFRSKRTCRRCKSRMVRVSGRRRCRKCHAANQRAYTERQRAKRRSTAA